MGNFNERSARPRIIRRAGCQSPRSPENQRNYRYRPIKSFLRSFYVFKDDSNEWNFSDMPTPSEC